MTPTTAHHLALMRLGLTVDEVAAVICSEYPNPAVGCYNESGPLAVVAHRNGPDHNARMEAHHG